MTRKEAVEILEGVNVVDRDRYIETLRTAADALVEEAQSPVRLDRNRWEGCPFCDDEPMALDWEYGLDHILPDYKFCPICGKPLTEEAWAELERRIGGNDG